MSPKVKTTVMIGAALAVVSTALIALLSLNSKEPPPPPLPVTLSPSGLIVLEPSQDAAYKKILGEDQNKNGVPDRVDSVVLEKLWQFKREKLIVESYYQQLTVLSSIAATGTGAPQEVYAKNYHLLSCAIARTESVGRSFKEFDKAFRAEIFANRAYSAHKTARSEHAYFGTSDIEVACAIAGMS